jgi:hypothetical protein
VGNRACALRGGRMSATVAGSSATRSKVGSSNQTSRPTSVQSQRRSQPVTSCSRSRRSRSLEERLPPPAPKVDNTYRRGGSSPVGCT